MERVPSVGWFSVRCVFDGGTGEGSLHRYEERITIWSADSFEDAIARAEEDAVECAEDVNMAYLGLAQAYELYAVPEDGAEVFSLVRGSDLPARDYLDRFYDTGSERSGVLGGP